MENKDSSSLRGAATAPFLTSLAGECASASAFVDHGLHPSLPNYLAATSGSAQGVADDQPPSAHRITADNIFRQVRATGGRAVSYEESMPADCSLQATALYGVKHNPAAYYVGADDRPACMRDDVPFERFAADLSSDALPAFSLITPNICNDMHSCPIATGDTWLRGTVDAITASTAYGSGGTIVFITFDESEGAGTMPFYAIAPTIRPGLRATTELDHASMLAFAEDTLGIAEHLGAAANAPNLAQALGLAPG